MGKRLLKLADKPMTVLAAVDDIIRIYDTVLNLVNQDVVLCKQKVTVDMPVCPVVTKFYLY